MQNNGVLVKLVNTSGLSPDGEIFKSSSLLCPTTKVITGYPVPKLSRYSSVGRAADSYSEGRWFEPNYLDHQFV